MAGGRWVLPDVTGNVGRVKVRKRLLVGSLVVSVVLSAGIIWVIAANGDDGSGTANSDSVNIDTDATLAPPGIGTNAAVEGAILPTVNVQTLEGDDVSTADLLGQPMVINVWGSTCGPCKKELPDFAAAHQEFGDRVRFVGVSYLPPSDHEESFARDKGVQYELFYDGNGEFISQVGIAAFPVTLFVAADGTIVQQTGQLDQAKLTSIIESELL
jgi:thiol-disulfide isomerase/thioredoxin